MIDLIARVLSGEAGSSDREELDRWRRATPENDRAYRECAQAWSLSAPGDAPGDLPPAPSPERIITEAERRQVVPFRRPRTPAVRWRSAVAAAAALIAVGVGVVWWQAGPEQLEFSTGPDQTRTVVLVDGSAVRMGPSTSLRVREAGQRTMTLRGVAFFAVAADTAHPFRVRTQTGEVEVLGTRFELRADADSLRLLVVEGRVTLSGGGRQVEVTSGGVGRILGNSPPLGETAEVWDLLDWPNGLLLYQATPLAQVLQEVGAHFGVAFVIRDSVLAGRTVTAWFDNEPLEEVVSTVCLVVGARCRLGDTVEVIR